MTTVDELRETLRSLESRRRLPTLEQASLRMLIEIADHTLSIDTTLQELVKYLKERPL